MVTAVMQPYIFPYLGYFQMINASDTFVFYDDVQFIKGGWINRNRIIVGNQVKYFTIPLLKATPNKLINEIYIDTHSKDFKNILKTINQSYKKSPYFTDVFPLLEDTFAGTENRIGEMAINSIKNVSEYLGISTLFLKSSVEFKDITGLERTARLIEICNSTNADYYINAPGGRELYSKVDFLDKGISLQFIESQLSQYKQGTDEFFAGLSIVDVLMHNSREEVLGMLNLYSLK
ncbi:WbqC family protein [Chryseobacterium caseinilyticum]|uniref:WbqC family protein n=1 Tax=Chryseobacterium caseinilyticum TaxID=2771428 RepID=A0ABR8ZAJ1_9FLAO|nr:WbqC family protein [Chryseobacterium caseinilyticum]MBD8082328.1 WbqC family protein [Chryseobacterium caseinilyticum]